MLYAIGGVPRSGKTGLAAKVHKQLGFSVFTTDAIVAAFMTVAPDLLIDYGHPERRKKVAPGLVAAVRQLTMNNKHYVIEGELLDPWLVGELQTVADVRACFLTMSKPDLATILKHEGSNAWVAELTAGEQQALISALQSFHDDLAGKCDALGIPYFDVSVGDYRNTIAAAYDHMVNQPCHHVAERS